jgi:hypothetical protein
MFQEHSSTNELIKWPLKDTASSSAGRLSWLEPSALIRSPLMYTKIDEIKYTDEIDHVIDGILLGEVSEAMEHLREALDDEGFRIYVRESRHVDEIVEALVSKEIEGRETAVVVLEILDISLNPYSVTVEGVFRLLLSLFRCLISKGGGRHELASILSVLRKIPDKWYGKYGECSELEELLYGLQLCAARGIISSGTYICRLLKQLPHFELEAGFATKVLKSRRNYEVLVNYTAKKDNVDLLMSTLEFRKCMEGIISLNASTGREVDAALKWSIILLINLADRGFYVGMSMRQLEGIYEQADALTKHYLSVLILMYARKEKQETLIPPDELQQHVKNLLLMSGSMLGEVTVQKLIHLID